MVKATADYLLPPEAARRAAFSIPCFGLVPGGVLCPEAVITVPGKNAETHLPIPSP